MDLQTLIRCLPQIEVMENVNPTITSIEMDSREVKAGSLFICVKGYTVDGHDFVQQAVEKGASVIVSEHKLDVSVPNIVVNDTKRVMAILADFFYGQPTQKLHLIGVTGTNGKTTVTHLLENIFAFQGVKTGLIGTINIKIGDQSYDVTNTTPESLVLQKTFSKMIDKSVDTALMEVSSHALHMGRVRGCDFDIAVFTNLTQDHLDYHNTMEEYKKAKGLLFSQLGNRFDSEKPKFAILNKDDLVSEEYMIHTGVHVLTYGIHQKSDIMATNIEMRNDGTAFTLVTPKGTVEITTELVGQFSIYNVLAATAAALASNIDLAAIQMCMKQIKPVPGRFELINENQNFTVIVDYAHTPDSLENVLTTINQFAKGNIYTIVGCGGDRDRKKRPIMAGIAEKYSDFAIFTSDNPRSEDPVLILQDMEKGVKENNYKTIIDRKEAISFAINQAQQDDVILIAGKGHETYQIIKNETIDFDDRIIARQAIKEKFS